MCVGLPDGFEVFGIWTESFVLVWSFLVSGDEQLLSDVVTDRADLFKKDNPFYNGLSEEVDQDELVRCNCIVCDGH